MPRVKEVKKIQIEMEYPDFEMLIEGVKHLKTVIQSTPLELKKSGTTIREQVTKVTEDLAPLVQDLETAWRAHLVTTS